MARRTRCRLRPPTHQPTRLKSWPKSSGATFITAAMEVPQTGYLHAVAAAAGCALGKPSPHVHGTDYNVSHGSAERTTDTVAARGGVGPSSALAWILLIILFPVIGALFFLVIGSPKLPQQRRDMQRSMDERIEERAADVGQVSAEHPAPPWLPSVARLNQTVGAMPLLEDNDAHVLPRFEEQLSALIAAVDASRRYIHVEFYILSLDASTDSAVELFVGEIGDQFLVFHAQHSYYQALLEAGVRIYLYPAPAILHAKHPSVDELVTVVGSSNMDIRSFSLDLELSLMTCGRAFADEDEYRRLSRELTLQEWLRRSRSHGLVDDLARLTSAVQ